ncbi:MAG: hypothetical protein H0V17_21345 [Deltaproteobacteria bacterium]|nr:hypothetical protein [Deltaproteobacteria bacterium]
MRNLVLVLVAACSGGSKPAPESPSAGSMLDCTKVADHVAATVAANKPRPGTTQAAVKDLVSTRCTADAWTDETKQCLNAITTIAEGRACAAKMTDEQRAAIKTQAKALRKDASPPVAGNDESHWIEHVVEEPGDAPPRPQKP